MGMPSMPELFFWLGGSRWDTKCVLNVFIYVSQKKSITFQGTKILHSFTLKERK